MPHPAPPPTICRNCGINPATPAGGNCAACRDEAAHRFWCWGMVR